MIKRILLAALLVPMIALAKPSPAAAHVGFWVSIGLPFFGAVVGVPGPLYGPAGDAVPVYAPPAYAPAPVFVPPLVYRPRVVYAPRRVFVPVYSHYGTRRYYRPQVVAHRLHRW